MHTQLKIPICILLISIFQPYTQSLRLYQLDPKEEDALIPKLNQLLGEPKSGSGSLKNDLFDRRERINDRSERFGKSVLVKRIVPHGYRSSNYEYDAKLNTLYKPLIRYHIRKPVEPQNRDLLSDIEADQKERDGSNNAVVVLLQRQRNEDYDQSGQDLEVRSSSDKDLLRQIQKFLSKNSARPKGKKSKLKKRFRGLLSTYKNSEGDLRTTFVQKSGEEHDPYAPGKLPPIVASEEHVTQKPKASLPKYSFWNYWTYAKNIVQDACRGHLVKVGNMCVSSIGHRKFLEPIRKSASLKAMNHRKFRKPLNNINLKKK